MTNPYESPSDVRHEMSASPGQPVATGLVGHVKVVAILMIVQAVLEILMGLLLIALGVFMNVIFEAQQMQVRQAPAPPVWIFTLIYGGLGILVLVSGILLLMAAIKNLKYRGRTLGIVALGCAAISLFTCYCAPTAIGLMIYGLIVYLNQDVARAFAAAEAEAETIAG